MESKFGKRDRARSFRTAPTSAEGRVWQVLRGRRLGGYKFRRQHAIAGFIVDFVCLEMNLIIEVDGAIHTAQQEQDAERDIILQHHGFQIVRIPNEQIEHHLAEVVRQIYQRIQPS
jgi:very-short-patch-repair endonuclease